GSVRWKQKTARAAIQRTPVSESSRVRRTPAGDSSNRVTRTPQTSRRRTLLTDNGDPGRIPRAGLCSDRLRRPDPVQDGGQSDSGEQDDEGLDGQAEASLA